ncbi:MAG: nickel pincer cofactor biosynthesis protein LarC [Deltaproteobacteria bacterium]|nr:MAG: nickel pincer cofactor biosynthesis protein LarC [Deltaproteobacteria bacterium]
MEMRVAYFDCFAGISGDMILGALLDLGLPPEVLDEGWRMLGLQGVKLRTKKVDRGGLTGTQVVLESRQKTVIRKYGEMREIIRGSNLPKGIKGASLKILERLARVEAKIHGVRIEEVHFHEIGGIDTLVDVVGSTLGVDYFAWDKVISSPLPLGRGWVEAAHGCLPLPAPATVELLQGVPIIPARLEGETVTPTGAAILTSLASGFDLLPEMVVKGVGYGAGTRDPAGTPNLLRIIHGAAQEEKEEGIWILEADIDDMSPEFFPYLNQLLLREGALDASQIPIQMKKGRPGFTIRVLSSASQREKLAQILLKESTTLGVRMYRAERLILSREQREVETKYGIIRIKVAFDKEGKIANIMPEYESCLQAAQRKGVPLKEVYQEALAEMRKIEK